MFKRGVYFGTEGGYVTYRYLRGGGYILLGLDYGCVAYSGEEGGIFWRDEWGSGRVAYLRGAYSGRAGYILLGYILGGRGRLWQCRI